MRSIVVVLLQEWIKIIFVLLVGGSQLSAGARVLMPLLLLLLLLRCLDAVGFLLVVLLLQPRIALPYRLTPIHTVLVRLLRTVVVLVPAETCCVCNAAAQRLLLRLLLDLHLCGGILGLGLV